LTDITAISYLISGLLEVVIPLVFAYFLIKRLGTSWRIWFIGALMFLVSLIRLPLNNYLTQIALSGEVDYFSYVLIYAIHGITAGVFEESARYLGYKHLLKDEHYETGLTYGAGHGGIESIFIVGLNVLSLGVVLLTNPEYIPPMQLNAIYSAPWYLPFVGLFERLMTMIIQICLSIMVLESLKTKQIKYFAYSVIIHAAIDYIAVIAVGYSILYAELVITGFAIGLAQWTYTRVKDILMA
jgi:uncharacterized membrane protein YhfC